MNKEEYKQYLKSDHWKDLRSRKLKHRKRCSICGSTERIEIHHLQYRQIYDVKTSDLRRLCNRCHTIVHDLIRSGKLVFTSKNHHRRWIQTKSAVLSVIRPKEKNEKIDRMVWLIGSFSANP